MLYLIFDDQVVGAANEPVVLSDLPAGYAIAEGDPGEIPDLYFDGEAVQRKPPRPSERHIWSLSDRGWVLPVLPESDPDPDWDALLDYLEDSPEGIKAYQASCLTLGANTAWTGLQTVLTKTRRPERLAFYLTTLLEEIEAVAVQGHMEDFSPAAKESFRQRLADLHFPTSVQAAIV